MRYHYEKPETYYPIYGESYICNHPIYNECTLYKEDNYGLAVIQQRYDKITKATLWTKIDPWLQNDIYLSKGFKTYFDKYAGSCTDGLYPTVTVRQIMYALRMKPLKRESWETAFDHIPI